MAEKSENIDLAGGSVSPDENAVAPLAREPWATPRVLAFERFAGAGGPPDMFAMEGTTYGPS